MGNNLPVHFDAANIMIDREIQQLKEGPTVVIPYCMVRLITRNGEIWDKAFFPYRLTVEDVVADWNKRTFEGWKKFDPTAGPPPQFQVQHKDNYVV